VAALVCSVCSVCPDYLVYSVCSVHLVYLVYFICSVCSVCLVCFVYARFPRDLATGRPVCVRRTGRCSPPPLSASQKDSDARASPGSKSWKIEAPPPSRSEKSRHPV